MQVVILSAYQEFFQELLCADLILNKLFADLISLLLYLKCLLLNNIGYFFGLVLLLELFNLLQESLQLISFLFIFFDYGIVFFHALR